MSTQDRTLRRRLKRLYSRLRGTPRLLAVRWHGTRSPTDGAKALALRAAGFPGHADHPILLLGHPCAFRDQVGQALDSGRLAWRAAAPNGPPPADTSGFAGIVCTETETATLMRCLELAQNDDRLSRLPFEFVTGLESRRGRFERHDEYAGAHFISPLMRSEFDVYALYEESLALFEQKCGLRDFLDLYQALQGVVQRQVSGAVCEFGSFRGHSGWLLARSLEHLGARPLYLFDTFDCFPNEPLGVDRFWSETHPVSFAAVQERLGQFPFVTLVKGDITATVPDTDTGDIALAYVDCDSFRAIDYLTRTLWEQRIPVGGMMVFEDYGHPALLGCRAAVHRFFDGRRDAQCFFSQFSGLMLVTKTA